MTPPRALEPLALLGVLAGCGSDCRTVAIPGRIEIGFEGRGAPSAYAVAGDCSGDGRPDVINGSRVLVARADGGFDQQDLGVAIPSRASAGTLVDLDADGQGDLVLAGPDVEWFRGLGGCRFAPGVALAPETRGSPSQVLATDVDLDGLTDLAVAYDQRTASPVGLLTAFGDGTFVDRSPTFAPHDPPYQGYGTFFDDVDGDGYREMFVVADFDEGRFGWGVPGDEPVFAMDATLAAVFADSHPMSLCPLDYDRDGRTDYFISGVTDDNLLLRGKGSRDLASVAPAAGLCSPPGAFAWGCAAFDVDLDGWDDLLVQSSPAEVGPAVPSRLYLNQRDGTFAAAAPEVFASSLNAHGLLCADFALHGRRDCMVTSQSTELGFVTMRNDVAPRGNWVGLRLRGTVSSVEASGARVSLDGAAPPLVMIVGGQSPIGGEHERGVVLAIGAADHADVTVTWPSGLRQSVAGLPAGRYTDVVEPRAVALDRRVAPADGAATVTVTVYLAAAGARAATVECSGACDWVGPAAADAGGLLRRSLRAPSQPGSARVVVTFDGAALRVRPRVRFTPP